MDAGLVRWARAVKQRRGRPGIPVLWLFTDARLADPVAVVAALPKGLCGVVLRHECTDSEAAALARLCRARRLVLVVAGDVLRAARLRAGVHLRAGRWAGGRRRWCLVTASAHDGAELRRAKRQGAGVIFLSPVFATASHPGAPALGAVRWARLAGGAEIYALGGVDGNSVKRLGSRAAGAGAITALL